MKHINAEVWLAICVAVLAFCYLYADMRLPEVRLTDPLGPKAFPALVGIGLLASAALLLLEERSRHRHRERIEGEHKTPAWGREPREPEAADNIAPRVNPLVLIAMVAWTVAYYLCFEPVGYVVSTMAFLFGLLAYFNRKRFVANAAIAIGVTAVFDLLFSRLLDVPMPTGILPF